MREDQEEYDDGLNAARGILLALGVSLVFWAMVIGAYCLGPGRRGDLGPGP